jgi:hypothetical protein
VLRKKVAHVLVAGKGNVRPLVPEKSVLAVGIDMAARIGLRFNYGTSMLQMVAGTNACKSRA